MVAPKPGKKMSTSQILMKQAPCIPVNSRFPVEEYFDRAERLLRQAVIYRVGRDVMNLFVLLARFSSLLIDTIPKHQDFKTSPEAKRRYKELKRPLMDAIGELEVLKKQLDAPAPAPAPRRAPPPARTDPPRAAGERHAATGASSRLDDLSIASPTGQGTPGPEVSAGPPVAANPGGPVDLLSGSDEQIAAAAAMSAGAAAAASPPPSAGLREIGNGAGKHSFVPLQTDQGPSPAPAAPAASGLVSYPSLNVAPTPSPEVCMVRAPPPPPVAPQVPALQLEYPPAAETPPAATSELASAPPPPPAGAPLQEMAVQPVVRQAETGMVASAPPPAPTLQAAPQAPPSFFPSPGGTRGLEEPRRVEHTPRVVQSMPTPEAAKLDYMNLSDRLKAYGLVEKKVKGDGNCQFRSLSDQLFGTTDRHAEVRRLACEQMKKDEEAYKPYVPEDFDQYLGKMTRDGEWGDHVTLQAAADVYGRRICVLSSYEKSFIIDIQPRKILHPRVLWLSFWAEVHYNSVYPSGFVEQ